MRKATSISLIISATILLSMTIGNPSVKAASEYKVYQLVQPIVTTQNVSNIAQNLFNITSPVVQENDELYFVNNSYPKYLEVYKVSGCIWYTDWSKMYNESYQPTLPSESAALATAESFLDLHKMKPQEAYFVGFGYTQTEIMGTTNASILSSVDVLYSFNTTDGIPIEGAGAKIRVSIGQGGEIIGFHWVWRNLSTFAAHPAITETEAQNIYLRKFNWTLAELEKHVAYFAEPGSMSQVYLQPYYKFSGKIETADGQVPLLIQKVPATTFSPRALISSPTHDSKAVSTVSLAFSASASGGLPPIPIHGSRM